MDEVYNIVIAWIAENITENTFIAIGTTISAVCSAYLVFINRAVVQPYIQRDAADYQFVNSFQHPVVLRQIIVIGGTFWNTSKEYSPGEGYEIIDSCQSINVLNRTVYFGDAFKFSGTVYADGKLCKCTAKVVKAAFGNKLYDVLLTTTISDSEEQLYM